MSSSNRLVADPPRPRPGRLAIASLLLLGIGGERHQKSIGSVPTRWRSPVAAFALAAVATVTGEDRHIAVADRFATRDLDKDGFLSESEYMRAVDGTPDASRLSSFLQADINDDQMLSMPEFMFALYISGEIGPGDEPEAVISEARRKIDSIFERLREQAFRGQLTFEHVDRGFRSFFPPEFPVSRSIKGLFRVADVIRDGILNLNELDLLHYMTRDTLGTSVGKALQRKQHQQEVAYLWRTLGLEVFDRDGDGRLSEAEAVHGLIRRYADTDREAAIYRKAVMRSFSLADVDGDGLLDREEAVELALGQLGG
mmetsp:Transcript_129310/g.374452  ORF Transcript_129310/g.374452 Transcript_129310/m.374452 type:complete len:313 (-) Transcript_129310:92-1030(-)